MKFWRSLGCGYWTRISDSSFQATLWTAVVACTIGIGLVPASAGPLQAEIDAVVAELVESRAYLGNYPSGNNDPNPVRRRFLGLDEGDHPISGPNPGQALASVIDQLVELSWLATDPEDRKRIDHLLNQSTQLSLQGWVISGNISLMEGMRVSYPLGSLKTEQTRPRRNPVPYGSLEKELDFLSIKDATRARLFYDEGIRVLLASLGRRPKLDRAPVIVDIDTQPIPSDKRDLPGAFDNPKFPQYTWYMDEGMPEDTSDDSIVPIQTQGYLMGNLLHKQGQATQSVGYRLWTAAYFSRQAQGDADIRKKLLDAAVTELHAGANAQFLSSIALAATVGDRAETAAQTPYEANQLHHTRNNVKQARDIISQIRANEKPILPIDEIMAGDAQVGALLATIESSTSSPGSITRAKNSYDKAKDALYRVHQTSEKVFEEEQNRQDRFLHRLEELTGEPIFRSAHDGIKPESLRTPLGQAKYESLVAARINRLMDSKEPDFASFENRLDNAIKLVLYHRQEVQTKKLVLDNYVQRIEITEATLGKNISAIKTAEGKITATQIALGLADSVSVTKSTSASVSTTASLFGPPDVSTTFTSGLSVHFNPGAIAKGGLQNNIVRANNVKEMQFLEHASAARVQNLLLDQAEMHEALRTQALKLRHAEDSVNKILGETQRVLAQLRAYDREIAELWYNDPVWNIELTGAEEEARRDIESLVANLYQLGRMLEIRWLEPFANPVSVANGDPVSLGPEYANFWRLESAFALPSVNVRDNPDLNSPPEQAEYFLAAMKKWDATLRKQRIFEGDLPVFEISLREDVFGLADVKTVGGKTKPLDTNPATNLDYEKDKEARQENIHRFQNILINNGLFKDDDPGKPRGFLLSFPLRYHQNGFTDFRLGNTRLFGEMNAWNYRLASFKVKILNLPGKRVFPSSSVGLYFAQAGTVENIDFFERLSGRVGDARRLRSYNLDNYVRYNKNDLGRSPNSPYLMFSFAKQLPEYPLDHELPKTADMAKRFWSPFTSEWLLQVIPSNGFEIDNIEDIWIQMTLTTGEPSCPPRWSDNCG